MLILIGQRQIAIRAVNAALLGCAGVATVVLMFSPAGPTGTLATALSAGCAAVLLTLCGLWASRWPSRPTAEVLGVVAAFACAAASLSLSDPVIGFGGCLSIALINVIGALRHSTRSVIAVSAIGTVTALTLGVQLAHRTADPALLVSAVAPVVVVTVILPLGVKVIARAVRSELREGDRDSLTGLYNRRAFLREVTSLTRMPRDPDDHLVVMVIDVDDFKKINDTAGHAEGDKALIAIAKTLRDECAMTAVIARYGGEEFAVADVLSRRQASDLAQQLCRRIAAISSPVPFTASVGWSSTGLRSVGLDEEARAVDVLLECADRAMYATKRGGGNSVGHEPARALGAGDEFSFDVWLHRSVQLAARELDEAIDLDTEAAAQRRLDAAVEGVGLQSVFQPIVSLADRSVVGFEVLTRWPQLDDPAPPDVLAQAETTGRTGELERKCIQSALRSGLKAGVGRECWLFLNTEASVTDGALASRRHPRLIFELTERRLLTHPGALLRKVDALRGRGYPIALDDVGAQPDSLALLDIVAPDVIKLERKLIDAAPGRQDVRALAAVLAHRERTGATILVEGIETPAQLKLAEAIGATLGQGYFFGRPAPPREWPGPTTPWVPTAVGRPPAVDARTPFDIVSAVTGVNTERKDTLVALSHQIENLAIHAASPPIVLAAFQIARHFPQSTRMRYERIAAVSPLVGIYAQGLSADAPSRLRTVALEPGDPLVKEWSVVVLGPDIATALIAREVDGPLRRRHDGDRLFAAALTNDRMLVTVAARSLLSRMR